MPRIQFSTQVKPSGGPPHHLHAFGASFVFHGLLFGALVGIGFLYQSQLPQPKNGSAPGAPTITLSPLVIVSPAPVPPTPHPSFTASKPVPSAPAITEAAHASPASPAQGAPVLAMQLPRPDEAPVAKVAARPATTSHPKPSAAAAPSSYTPGPSVLPHPPYPEEARDLQQSGTVLMTVRFDSHGGIAEADVAQSSGVPLLDSTTRSFIRTHWHSPAYAGQTVSVPVQYSLQNF